ncbi:MAG: porin family protein [Tannerella sp.]|nr:porin family protein [Tannerella sp.]
MIVSGLLSLSAFPLTATAQNSTNSPYTRYGYGELANRSFGAGRSMGGVGIGLRSSKQINPMNPASYSSMDSMTFLFDFGASAQLSWFSDGTNSQNDINGNVEYMAMQFPVHRRIAMSAGLLPYTHVGYNFEEYKTSNGQQYRETFTGTGGLNLLYAGLSVDVWKKRLSVGGNINYLFGSISHTAATAYVSSNSTTSVTNTKWMKFNDVTFDLGLQYTHPLSKTERAIVGLTYSPKKRLNGDLYQAVSSTESVVDTITDKTFELPTGYGAGLSYVKDNKLIIAADFTYQEWEKTAFEGNRNVFKNRSKISAGVEYIPNLYSRPFFNRVRYRAGLSYANSYIMVNGNSYKEYGATVGLGFPISDVRSFINVSFEYMKIQPGLKTMINEDYLRMTLSYTFNELWFHKRKID